MTTTPTDLPPLPLADIMLLHPSSWGTHKDMVSGHSADQLQAYARQAVERDRERAAVPDPIPELEHENRLLRERNERLEKEAEWVPVSERLPPPFEEVLVHPRPTDYCCEASVNTQGAWSYAEHEQHFGQHSHTCRVTHWKLMPAAPSFTKEGA